MTMYSEIVVPSEGDGSTFTLVGHGYYRGNRLAAVHYRLGSLLIDLALFYALYLPLRWLDHVYAYSIAPHLPYELWALQTALAVAVHEVGDAGGVEEAGPLAEDEKCDQLVQLGDLPRVPP